MARVLLFGLLLSAGITLQAIASDSYTLKNPGPTATEVPLSFQVPKLEPGVYYITPLPKGDEHPAFFAEAVGAGDSTVVYAVAQKLATGESKFAMGKVAGTQADEHGSSIQFVPIGQNLQVRIADKEFTTYRTDDGPKPFFFPLLGDDGTRYTRAFPMEKVAGEDTDHPHQRSLWFTYGLVNGVDFWSEVKGHGSIKETSRKLEGTGHVRRTLRTTDDWLDANGKKLMEDERVVTIWNTKTRRIIDFDVTLKATAGPVVFGDTKEGMFGVRVPSSMDVKAKTGGKILNANGIEDVAAWGKQSPWVDYSGPVNGKTIGIAILERPDSFNHPSPWHVRDYGLFAVNPFGKHEFGLASAASPTTLDKGKSLQFHYRVILHPGDAKDADCKSLYEMFAHPPKVESGLTK